MNKVIQVLETMATDAYLISDENISAFLTNTEITSEQQQAITEKNVGKLAKTVTDLPEIISFSQVLPTEEDEQEEDEQENNNPSTSDFLASSF